MGRPSSRLPLWVVFACCLVACESTIRMTTTGPIQPSRGDHCDFAMLTAVPASGFVEIGTIDIIPMGGDAIRSLDRLGDRIEPYVCKAGGDAVMAVKNGLGVYIQATVLKSAGPAPGQAAAAPNAKAADGCHYDTQCKGDRICVDGGCVDPPVKK